MPRIRRTLGAKAPNAPAAALVRELGGLVARVRATLPRVTTEADARALGAAVRREWPEARIAAAVRSAGEDAERAASRPWAPLTRARERGRDAKAYDGRRLVERWTKDATGLIKSVRDELAPALAADIRAAAKAGTPADELAARWIRHGVPVEFGTLEGRLRTIARHQLSILHANVQSERARAVGVTAFIWRTQGDDRVRDEHQALDGTRFAYDDPPDEGLPGTPVNCRCWAESIIPDDLAEALGLAFVIGS